MLPRGRIRHRTLVWVKKILVFRKGSEMVLKNTLFRGGRGVGVAVLVVGASAQPGFNVAAESEVATKLSCVPSQGQLHWSLSGSFADVFVAQCVYRLSQAGNLLFSVFILLFNSYKITKMVRV